MFKKILIANRGEIAVRVARACRELKIPSVAVFSDVDKNAKHVQMSDEAYPLGDSRPSASYLHAEKIIAVAKKAGAQAIHPGYGFLSENDRFAEACEKEGIVFIGPPPEVIRRMGDKIGARNLLKKHMVPLVPGTDEALGDLAEARRFAERVGYPILLKASAGGGGKGMRIVHKKEDLASALEGCRREAQGAFGDDRIFVEKYITRPRHIEFQILADSFGNVIHLFERECSIQRRYQKIIEETPSPAIDEDLRKAMGEVAVTIGKLIRYRSLGTIEFILDQNRDFYFLEANTRLQVEHPITETVTGIDLVKAQIRIAAGAKISFALPVRANGHSIECRIYAEDPENQFLPSVGTITKLREPTGEGIRVDSGISEGWTVPMEYDPLLSKLIVHAPSRERALLKMIEALASYTIEGIRTNIPFMIDLLRHPEFIAGRLETGLIDKYFQGWRRSYFDPGDPFNPFHRGALREQPPPPHQSGVIARDVLRTSVARTHHLPSDLTSPMPGQVIKVLVCEGQAVSRGDPVMVIEAMKMEHSIFAPDDGTVKKIFYRAGDKVGMGEKLVELS